MTHLQTEVLNRIIKAMSHGLHGRSPEAFIIAARVGLHKYMGNETYEKVLDVTLSAHPTIAERSEFIATLDVDYNAADDMSRGRECECDQMYATIWLEDGSWLVHEESYHNDQFYWTHHKAPPMPTD